MPDKVFLVLDTWVIATAVSENEPIEDALKAQTLLNQIYRNCHRVVLDIGEPKSEILKEWWGYLKKSPSTRNWYKGMNSSNKVDWRDRNPVKLNNFPDPNDEKFIEVAVTLSDRIFVTGEEKLLEWAHSDEATRLRIRVWDMDMALANL